ncbi:hypothetical protein CAPTEDRAFT_192114 [Capitella teleta]|uniref:Uncharacterized protein n=1 Tax=Capitella teleta TaxID=283909 RepID=R7TY18_CAPTE|nr:hypothetical protein CAPTEDRAFT_192114 [Capitella teleta]|eukprot:ELT96306.1 hypothetical protein CAPTEDRAFT_192114 [Capitella teleta]
MYKLHMVSNDRLGALQKHYRKNGIAPKEKKNGGRAINKQAFDLPTIEHVSGFLQNYADQHALVLPGRVPGYWRDDARLLPAAHTKTFVFDVYSKARTLLCPIYTISLRVMASTVVYSIKLLCTCKPVSTDEVLLYCIKVRA